MRRLHMAVNPKRYHEQARKTFTEGRTGHQSGRNVDLGSSNGIQAIGNFLDPSAASTGASITIETSLGSLLT
jgi:hypothetical protein